MFIGPPLKFHDERGILSDRNPTKYTPMAARMIRAVLAMITTGFLNLQGSVLESSEALD
jgi:hypothetical protein